MERAWFAASEMTRSIVLGLDKKLLEMAATEVNWLALPENSSASPDRIDAINSELIPPVFAVGSGRNKDGSGGKRKNSGKLSDVSPTSDYHSQNGGSSVGGTHFGIIEDFVASEETMLSGLFSVLSAVSGLIK